MLTKQSFLLLFSLFFIASCGGGGGGSSDRETDNGDTNVAVIPNGDAGQGESEPAVPERIEISLDETYIRWGTGSQRIVISAFYSDNTEEDISGSEELIVSTYDTRAVYKSGDYYFYSSNYLGENSVLVEFRGAQDVIDVEVHTYFDYIDIKTTPTALPLDGFFPMTKHAWAYWGGLGSIEASNDIEYRSSNTAVGEFLPKTDDVVVKYTQDPNIGQLYTKQTGSTRITMTYQDQTVTHNVTVYPHRLLSTSRSDERPLFNIFDLDIDENGDSFYLYGHLQVWRDMRLRQYSRETGEWLPEIVLNTPDAEMGTYFANLHTNKNFIVATWDPREGPKVSVHNRNSNTTTHIDNEDFRSTPIVAFDSRDRLVLCWGLPYDDTSETRMQCRVYNTDGSLAYSQSFDFGFSQIALDDNDVFFVVSGTNQFGPEDISGYRYRIGDESIDLVDSAAIASRDISRTHFCEKMFVSPTGHMVCTFFSRGDNPQVNQLHTVTYHTDTGWKMEDHLPPVNDYPRYSITRSGVGIAPNGDIIIMLGDSRELEVVEYIYTHGEGWGEPTPVIDTSPATGVVEHDPVYTSEGWKFFEPVLRTGLLTRTDSGWGNAKAFPAYGVWSGRLGSINEHVKISPTGEYSLMWAEYWGHPTEGGVASNTLYFALPAGLY